MPLMVLSICFLVILASLICILFSQRYKLKMLQQKSENLSMVEQQYQQALLENSKLQERCLLYQNLQNKHDQLLSQHNELQQKYAELERNRALIASDLEHERRNLEEKIKLLENAEQKLSNTFKAISSDALSQNNTAFLDLAKSAFEQLQEKAKSEFSLSTKSMNDLVIPIKSALENVDIKLGELEKTRVGAYEALKQQVNDMMNTQKTLKDETNHLVSALKMPSVRGRWGEMQLRRVVELAGMLEHCDFEEQVEVSGDANGSVHSNGSCSAKDFVTVRPDMVIYLPGDRQIIVDAKAPLSAYLQALESNDDRSKKNFLKEHARQIRNHISTLANKKYWAQFEKSPEFVIMFLPGEVFLSVATEYDRDLIEFAMQQRVIISTPTILLGLLYAVAQGWRQENLAENAKQIIGMGRELYQRLAVMTEHMGQLGKSINSVVQNYNSTIGSLETRVLSSARKFKDFEVHEKNIIELLPIERSVRRAPEPEAASSMKQR